MVFDDTSTARDADPLRPIRFGTEECRTAAAIFYRKKGKGIRGPASAARIRMSREYPQAPLAGVGAVIVHHGRVLLVQRATEPMKGHWSIPGGLVELGESLAEAVVREAFEETGLHVQPLELIELVDRIHREDGRVRYHYVVADYLCRVTGGVLAAASDAADVRWLERDEWLASSTLEPAAVRIIEAAWQRARQLNLGEGN